MSAIFGIFNRNDEPVEQAALERMVAARPERGPDGEQCWIKGHIALAHQQFWITPEEWGEAQPVQASGCTICCDARLDNRRELSRLLALDGDEAREVSDSTLILWSYLRWGTDCLQYLRGDYAFVIWDEAEQHLFLVRDALGARDVCYYVDESRAIVASEVSQVLAHPAVEARINDNKVAARLVQLWDKPEETYYTNIFYLAPAHGMIVTREQIRTWRHWDIDPDKSIRYRDEREYGEHYLTILREAVNSRLRTVGPAAISLSGGLDSSAIAALSAPKMQTLIPNQKALISYSYAFDELKSCDEREYIKTIVEKYEIAAKYLPCDDKWTLKDLDNWPSSRDAVNADPYILLPATVLAEAARSGIRLLLAGYFGDTLFGGGRYWALDMMRGLRFGLLLRTLVEDYGQFEWRQALFEDGVRQLLPKKGVRAFRSRRPRQHRLSAPGIHPDLVTRTDMLQRLGRDDVMERFSKPGQGHRYRTLTLSVFSQGLAVSRHWYNQHGVELAMPYYDRRLVEFVMAIPAEELGRPGEERRTHRQAMKNILPETVLQRHGFTSFVPLRNRGLLDKEQETVKKILKDPLIVQRKYIDPAWLQKQKEKDLDMSADGIMLWTALSLELWLQRYLV